MSHHDEVRSSQLDPFGRSNRRATRLSDEETARRMLDAGVRMVHETGLQLSSDLLRLEDVIQEADVSRSAVYRRWPTKAHYFADLLRELAGTTHPARAAYDRGTVDLAVKIAEENLELLSTPRGRKIAMVEMCRRGALQNFKAIASSAEWQTYVAMQGTLLGLSDELTLQGDLYKALRRSEEGFIGTMADFYRQMTRVVGYQLRDFSNLGFETLATLGAAVVEGLSITSITLPEIGEQRFEADPFGTMTAEWSVPALGFASIVMTIVEPEEPQVDWDESRLAEVHALLQAIKSTVP